MKIMRILIPVFVFALIIGFTGVINAAPPEASVRKGPPNLEKITLVHYAKDFPAGNPHGAPPGQDKNKPDGGNTDNEKPWYKYSGLHWGSMPVEYYISSSELTAGFNLEIFSTATRASFEPWDNASTTYSIENFVNTPLPPDNLLPDGSPDGSNIVGWKDLGNSNAIATTYMWYNTLTRELIDVDTALHSNAAYAWWQNAIIGDPDLALWTADFESNAYDVDVQNIMTHEAGHWLVLDDFYQKPANSQTMYGISAQYELKKRSLENGDIAGIQTIYPNP